MSVEDVKIGIHQIIRAQNAEYTSLFDFLLGIHPRMRNRLMVLWTLEEQGMLYTLREKTENSFLAMMTSYTLFLEAGYDLTILLSPNLVYDEYVRSLEGRPPRWASLSEFGRMYERSVLPMFRFLFGMWNMMGLIQLPEEVILGRRGIDEAKEGEVDVDLGALSLETKKDKRRKFGLRRSRRRSRKVSKGRSRRRSRK